MRTHLNNFIKDQEKNIYNVEIKELKKDSILLVLDSTFNFSIEVISENTFKLRSDDEYLQEWVESVESSTLEKSFSHIGEYLEEVTGIYTEMPEDDTSTIGSITPLTVTPSPFPDGTPLSSRSDEIERQFNEAILSPSEQAALQKQKEMVRNHHFQQVEKTKGNQQFSNVFKECSKHELKGSLKKDVKQLYLNIYRDGYTVGYTMDPKSHGELRDVKDSVMKSFQAGYVPPMYAGTDKEVDVHFIHKEFKYKDRVKELLKKQKEKEEKKKELEARIMREEMEKLRELEDKVFKIDETIGEKSGSKEVEEEESEGEEEEVGEKKSEKSYVLEERKYVERKKIVVDVKKSSYVLDTSKELTMIKFSFPDNSKLIQKFCVHDKVEVVKKFVLEVTSEKDCDLFMTSMKITGSLDKTLKEMNVLNSIIIVKFLQI